MEVQAPSMSICGTHCSSREEVMGWLGQQTPQAAKQGGFDHNLHQVQRLHTPTTMFKTGKGGCGDPLCRPEDQSLDSHHPAEIR